ncbi:MAG: NUDIX hydrolase [Candidatus Dormibacteria bacterium]
MRSPPTVRSCSCRAAPGGDGWSITSAVLRTTFLPASSSTALALRLQDAAARQTAAPNILSLIQETRLLRAAQSSPAHLSQLFTGNQSVRGQQQNAGLPRPAEIFEPYGFGPGVPIPSSPIDRPDPDSGMPEPRRFQYPVAFNLPIGVPGSEGLKLVSFQMLRAYAEMTSLARACIEVRKNEILGMDYDIVPTADAEKQMRDDKAAHQEFQQRRKEALAFWARPDPNYDTFQSWFSAVLEGLLTIDAAGLFLHPTRVRGKGLFGTDYCALDLIDGSTIRPVLDLRGGTPRPPAPAYQQYLWGVPRADLTDVIHDADIDDISDDMQHTDSFARDQLLYLRMVVRDWTPYGFPPGERCIISQDTFLKRQATARDYFTEGSIPAAFAMIGGEQNASAPQARIWQDTINALAGDIAWKQKVIALPAGSSVHEMQEHRFNAEALRAIQDDILMNYDVMPTELGLPPSANLDSGLGGKGMAKGHENVTERKATKPFMKRLTGTLFNYFLQAVCGQHDMEWTFTGLQPSEDIEKQANADKIYVSIGAKTPDEIRLKNGDEPFGLPGTSDPFVLTATGPVSLGSLTPADTQAEEERHEAPAAETDTETAEAEGAEARERPPAAGLKPGAPPDTAAPAAAESPLHSSGEAGTVGTAAGENVTSQASANRGVTAVVRKQTTVAAAGLAVVARETGRVLMLQRSLDPGDPAAGRWEFPGGHIEDDETALEAAQREWSEEIGQPVPDGVLAGMWTSPNGVYQGFVWSVDGEDTVLCNADADDRGVLNPDDPDGDCIEVVAWWDPLDLPLMPALRSECRTTDWAQLNGPAVKVADAEAELAKLRQYLRHGKSLAAFEARALPPMALVAAKAALPGGANSAVRAARKTVAARIRKRARTASIAALRGPLHKDLTDLAMSHKRSSKAAGGSFVSAAKKRLATAYTAAYAAGAGDYDPDVDPQDDLSSADTVEQRSNDQVPFLEDWAAVLALAAGSDSAESDLETANRAGMYANTIQPAYDEGQFDAVHNDLGGGETVTWHISGGDHVCERCTGRDGADATIGDDGTLTWPDGEQGFPGDGSFGGLCVGGVMCRCGLDYSGPDGSSVFSREAG